MKNKTLYIWLSLIFILASCQPDNKVDFYDLGSEFFISGGAYSSLDNQATINIENQQKNLSEITVTNLGGTIIEADGSSTPFESTFTGTIPISEGAGSIVLSDVDLGITSIGSTASLKFSAVFNGKPFSRSKSITVSDPISIDAPVVNHRADTIFHFKFSIDPATATVGSVTVETKVSSAGTYVALAGPFNAADSIPIKGSDYNIGDTLFVKVIGTAGSKTATTVTEVVIQANSATNVVTFVLDYTADQAYDLMEAKFVSASGGGETADIQFTGEYNSQTPLMIGFESLHNAQFVPSTADDYAVADLVNLSLTDFSNPITFNNNVSGGEVYIFRTKRGSGSYFYGIMMLKNVEKPQGVLENSSITIEYKY